MSVSGADIAFATELFSGLPDLTSRKMMGGLSIYSQGTIFAILSSDAQVYLKAQGDFADELAAQGARIFSMTRKDGTTGTMGYWTLPDAALDDPDVACDWARRALAVL